MDDVCTKQSIPLFCGILDNIIDESYSVKRPPNKYLYTACDFYQYIRYTCLTTKLKHLKYVCTYYLTAVSHYNT